MSNFDRLKNDFEKADTDEKINMYLSAEGLSKDEYLELLRMFPLGDISRLEKALG